MGEKERDKTSLLKAERSRKAEVWRRLQANKGAMLGLVVVVLLILIAVSAGFFMDYDTDVIGQNISQRLQGPSLAHPFGTDDLGRDLLARILYGTRYSLAIGLVSVGLAIIVGVLLGAFAGYYGGLTEDIIMRLTDILAAVPGLLLGAVIVASLGANIVNLMIALGFSAIPQFVRITRASVLTVREQEYVEASRAIGISEWKIIMFHILPNCMSPIIVTATLRVAQNIISASAMSFLGLGVPSPAPEWGALLSAGRNYVRTQSYLTIFPGIAIMITVLALNLLGDGLRDALDPKLRR